MPTTIIGASSGPGRLLFDQLRDEGEQVVGIARSAPEVVTNDNARFIELDAMDATSLLDAIDNTGNLIHCSRPEILTNLLNHLVNHQPKLNRLIAIGSTRIYTRFPDEKCSRLSAMSHALSMSDLPYTLLHPL